MNMTHSILIILTAAVFTVLMRAFPFLIFSGRKTLPSHITYLGTVLPYAAIAILVVFCLKNVRFAAFPFGLPEIISIITVGILHVWKRNNLLSIGAGTALYMFLVQQIF